MKIKKGDQVLIISGKNKGKKGKILKALPREEKVVVEGINIRKKHLRGRRMGEKGQIIELPLPIHIANVQLVCPKCGKTARVGYKIVEAKKYRICKKCQGEI